MTVASTVNKIQYNCNGVATAFPVTFKILQAADLRVTLTDGTGTDTLLVINTQYTVAPAVGGYVNGATVTTVATYTTGYRLTILRNVGMTQNSSLPSNGPFPSESVETALDKLTMITQQHEEQISRQVIFPESTQAGQTPGELLTALGEAVTGSVSAKNSATAAMNAASDSAAAALASEGTATDASVDAIAAQAAAEAAREAAVLASGVYADTTAGLAATTDGEYFSVPSAESEEFLILYKNDTGTAVEAKIYPYDSVIANAFNILPEKNIYDPALAEDGKLYGYTTGIASTYANGIVTGRIPVSEGNTYTLWMSPLETRGFYPHVYCWAANGTYLGMDALITTNPVVADMNLVAADGPVSLGYRKLTFTIPTGSGVAFVGTNMLYNYVAHTTGDFNRIRLVTQLELGVYSTKFVAHTGKPTAQLKYISDYSVNTQGVLLIVETPDCYVRTKWDATRYLVQKITYNSATAYTNNSVNFSGARLIAISTAAVDTVAAFAAGEILATQSDDNCPVNYSYPNTYMAANHGALVVSVTATSHGKTVADVGSKWTDGGSYVWYIIRVVDSNTLWMMAANTATYPNWTFRTVISGNLTHVENATHTGAITVGSQVATQLLPGIQNLSRQIMIDGADQIAADGIYQCKSIDIVESYDILNPAAVLNYVISCVGGSVQPAFDAAAITDKDMHFDIMYHYALNGSCTVYHNIYAYRAVTFNYAGFIQATVLAFATPNTLHQYVPGMESITAGARTWNLAATEDISGTIPQLTLAAASWTDPNNPPSRIVQFVKDGSDNEFGFVLGYSPLRGLGVPASRKELNSAGFIYTSKKQYPYCVDAGIYATLPANTLLECVAYRSYYPCNDATVLTWYQDGNDYVVIIDYHVNVSQLDIPLPAFMTGKTLTVIEKHANLTLHTGAFVSASGIKITVTDDYGFIVLKIS